MRPPAPARYETWRRPKGSCVPRAVFLTRNRDVLCQLKAGQSVRNTAKITGKGVSTVQRVRRLFAPPIDKSEASIRKESASKIQIFTK